MITSETLHLSLPLTLFPTVFPTLSLNSCVSILQYVPLNYRRYPICGHCFNHTNLSRSFRKITVLRFKISHPRRTTALYCSVLGFCYRYQPVIRTEITRGGYYFWGDKWKGKWRLFMPLEMSLLYLMLSIFSTEAWFFLYFSAFTSFEYVNRACLFHGCYLPGLAASLSAGKNKLIWPSLRFIITGSSQFVDWTILGEPVKFQQKSIREGGKSDGWTA